MKIFLARQAIYDINEKIVAYEILYRSSLENLFDKNMEDEEATYKVIQNISSFGLDVLTNNKTAFINFSTDVINSNMATLLPKEKTIVEVLETVEPTKEVIENLRNLKNRGYRVALDDISRYSQIEGFLDVIDIVKIDYRLSDKYERFRISQELKGKNVKMLAEKIEEKEELEEAKILGFDYFQGYYLSKPVVLQREDIEIKNGTIFNIIMELLKDEFDIDRIEELIKYDIGLTYKFLKFINSAYFNFIQEVSSIKRAVMLVGKNELRKWLSIISISEMNSVSGLKYAKNSIIRARMCEIISEKDVANDKNSAFMVGLFSNIHILMEKSLSDLISGLPVKSEVREALLGEENIYRDILDLVMSYEKIESEKIDLEYINEEIIEAENIDLENIKRLINKLELDIDIVRKIYLEAVEWVLGISNY